jgi:hypothetical protein
MEPRYAMRSLLLLVAGGVSACASAQGDWARLRDSDSRFALTAFVDRYPDSPYADSASTRIAEIDRAYRERVERLAAAAEVRVASGSPEPAHPADPEHPIAHCLVNGRAPESADGVVATGFQGQTFVCANSAAGAAILRYRQWYCEGEEDSCVLGRWRDGQPTFQGVETRGAITDFGDVRFEFAPTDRGGRPR